MEPILTVFLVSLLAGCATGLGALPILLSASFSHRVYDAALGLAAGIMFGAAVFALIVPGMEIGSLAEVLLGVLLGGLFLLIANRSIPHVHPLINGQKTGERDAEIELSDTDTTRRALLVGGSITIHNIR